MRPAGSLARAIALGALALTSLGCPAADEPRFGEPNSLANQKPPTPYPGGGAGADSGNGGAICSGGPAIDGGACAVTFTAILANMAATGPWKCADATCHGGATPPFQPGIDPADPNKTWDTLRTYTIAVSGKPTPYINPCSQNEADSAIACNMRSGSTCGAQQMPQTGGAVASANATDAEMGDLVTWVKCGAPNN